MKIITYKQIHNLIISTIVFLWLWVLLLSWIWTTENQLHAYDPNNPRESQDSLDTSVSVRIVYDFEGYIKRGWSLWNQFYTWDIRWTNDPNIYVQVWADKTSTYKLTWWVDGIWTWNGVWSYNKNQFTILSWSDGLKYIYSDYVNMWGIYSTGIVSVGLDRVWPSKAKISFTSWAIYQQPFTITWKDADIDTWVGWSKYIIHIALDPNFASEIKKDLYTESYYLDTSKFPLGTIWRYIESVDHLWNSTPSEVFYFHNTLPSIPSGHDVPDDLEDYYDQITTDKIIQDVSTWALKNIFDIVIKAWSGTDIKYGKDDIKTVLIYNYLTHGVADVRQIPTWVPETWVDGIMRYLDKMVKDVNKQITDPKAPLDKSLVVVSILLLLLCIFLIWRSRSWCVDKVCDSN